MAEDVLCTACSGNGGGVKAVLAQSEIHPRARLKTVGSI
jgi:hypothetical protein